MTSNIWLPHLRVPFRSIFLQDFESFFHTWNSPHPLYDPRNWNVVSVWRNGTALGSKIDSPWFDSPTSRLDFLLGKKLHRHCYLSECDEKGIRRYGYHNFGAEIGSLGEWIRRGVGSNFALGRVIITTDCKACWDVIGHVVRFIISRSYHSYWITKKFLNFTVTKFQNPQIIV